MKNKFLYKNIFMYASLQFCGNIEEYFSKHTVKLLVYIVMPRLKNKFNLVRLYKKGELIEEKKVPSSDNIFLYYFLWYFYQIFFLLKYFSGEERFFLLGGHPICFFGLRFQRLVRNVSHIYWVGDYFPAGGITIKLFEKLKKYYHERVKYSLYLSDRINAVFNNGRIINTTSRKTIMWGVKPKNIKRNFPKDSFTILFVGLIKDYQGLEFMFDFLKSHKDYKLNIIGICDDKLYGKYMKTIKKLGVSSQVFFPNQFFSDKDLEEIAKKCHVGIALYNIDKSNPTYYTDPGKVKAYAELELPVIMSDTSGIVAFVKKFGSGIIIDQLPGDLAKTLRQIKNNYNKYLLGIKHFNKHFYYEKYYGGRFSFLS